MLLVLWIIENELWNAGYNDDEIQDDWIRNGVMSLIWFTDKKCDWFWYELLSTLWMFKIQRKLCWNFDRILTS
jgi:hypothetical protein